MLRATEILEVVGETGAGKSILARSLIGLLPPGVSMIRGETRLEGRSLSGFEGEERRHLRGGRIALIGTNAKALLDPVAPVGRQIARVLRAHEAISSRAAHARAVDILRDVGITDPEHRAKAYPT